MHLQHGAVGEQLDAQRRGLPLQARVIHLLHRLADAQHERRFVFSEGDDNEVIVRILVRLAHRPDRRGPGRQVCDGNLGDSDAGAKHAQG